MVERYRTAVDDVARWLEGVAVEHGDGLAWPGDPDEPDDLSPSLGWGGAGPVLFFADAHRLTGDPRTAQLAQRGARWLRSVVASAEDVQAGLFTGLAGLAVVFAEVHRATGDPEGLADLDATLDRVVGCATETPEGVQWEETTEILWGTAGIGCLLLTIGRDRIGEDAVALAVRAGDWLLSQAREAPVGCRWTMGDGPARERPRMDAVWFPNFAHGTAGIAGFLAKLSAATGERRFLDAALAGARWVLSVSKTDGDVCMAQHHDPAAFEAPVQIGAQRPADDRGPLYTIGWCHGPPGLAWLFRELQLATSDDEWGTWVGRAAKAVRASGIPARREPGFWDNVGRCCGSAGVAELFLDLHAWRGDADDLAFARLMMDDTLDRAIVDDDGMRWSNVEFRLDPPELPPDTSFLQGASGIGCTLVRLVRHLDGDRTVIRWPHAPVWTSADAPARASESSAVSG